MPMYQIHHFVPLAEEQRDTLARAITYIHSRKFSTPSLFVNVKFVDANGQYYYAAGERRDVNHIIAYVRGGGTRTQADFDAVLQDVVAAWDNTVNGGQKGSGNKALKVVFLNGSIIAGMENGFLVPGAGQDQTWIRDNKAEFEKLASEGDTAFVNLLHELKTRKDLALK